MTLAGYAPLLTRVCALYGSLIVADADLESAGLIDGSEWSSKGARVVQSLGKLAFLSDTPVDALPTTLTPLLRRLPPLLAAAVTLPDTPPLPELALFDDAGLTERGRRVLDELAHLALLLDVELA